MTILVLQVYEVTNGLVGMKRDAFLKLCEIMLKKTRNVRIMIGICVETLLWRKHQYFIRIRSLAHPRIKPPSPTPARQDPATLWFEKGDNLEVLLDGRNKSSIRAIGGVVQARDIFRHGPGKPYYPSIMLYNLEFLDLRKTDWKVIDELWFKELGRLSHVELPPKLEKIAPWVFSKCESLNEIWFPPSLRELGSWTFLSSNLVDVILPPDFETLNCLCFSDCRLLRKVVLPAAMKRIGHKAFDYCVKLETLVVGDVNEWGIDIALDGSARSLGSFVQLKELHLTGRCWDLLPVTELAYCLTANARVIGPNFVGRKVGNIIVTTK